MIFEFLQYLTSPSSALSKKMGYLYESIALEAKYQRCRKSWQGHLDNCRSSILEFVKQHPESRQLYILGSGPLHEIPLQQLLSRFEQITLVDLVHPKSAQQAAKENPGKLRLLEVDLSGVLSELLKNKNRLPETIQKPNLQIPTQALVISANLLSQLALAPEKQACKNLHCTSGDERVQNFKKKILLSHLEFMQFFADSALLYSDIERHYLDKNNQLIQIDNSVCNLKLTPQTKSWFWLNSPLGEEDSRYSVNLKMICLQIRKSEL